MKNAIHIVAALAAICGAAKAGNPISLPAPCPYPSLNTTWGTFYNNGILCFVGSDPRAGANTTILNVPVVPVIIRLLGANGKVADVSDPTKPLWVSPIPNSNLNALDAVLASPIFAAQDFKFSSTDLGTMQWGEAVEKASFWKFPSVDFKDWHLEMLAFPSPPLTLDVPYGSWYALGNPHSYAVDNKVLDPFLDKLMSETSAGLAPIFLTYNIAEYQHGKAGCCDFGYHDWYQSGGIYSFFIWASYMDSPADNPDLMSLSHEVAEFVHDPFGNNSVPPWPAPFTFTLPWDPPYKFTKCQGNLEVGDPLEDRSDPAKLDFVITNSTMEYHFQNVVTASWEMQASPSFSVNGWYTLKGAVDGEFAAPAPACPTT